MWSSIDAIPEEERFAVFLYAFEKALQLAGHIPSDRSFQNFETSDKHGRKRDRVAQILQALKELHEAITLGAQRYGTVEAVGAVTGASLARPLAALFLLFSKDSSQLATRDRAVRKLTRLLVSEGMDLISAIGKRARWRFVVKFNSKDGREVGIPAGFCMDENFGLNTTIEKIEGSRKKKAAFLGVVAGSGSDDLLDCIDSQDDKWLVWEKVVMSELQRE